MSTVLSQTVSTDSSSTGSSGSTSPFHSKLVGNASADVSSARLSVSHIGCSSLTERRIVVAGAAVTIGTPFILILVLFSALAHDIQLVAQAMAKAPVADASVDNVLSTWTLCTIPDAMRALAEIRRVLRPGGAFRFVEHGLAPDARVARRQQWITPLQRRAFGGCHLNRRIDQMVAVAGFELTRMDTYYMKGPQALGYTFEGVAVRP